MIDLRSDADTLPTDAMRQAMANAPVGDDILGEDPTTNELESYAAAVFGKEAALLTISGTMSNQLAIMTMTARGDEIIVGDAAHIYNLEVAGLATLSQVQARPLAAPGGCFDLDELRDSVHPGDIQRAHTSLICTESTYDLNAGHVPSLEHLRAIYALAQEHGIRVYLDGARLFNAAAVLDTSLDALAATADALQVCLTKGLGCPLGSLLLGSKTFIQEAKRMRQRIGGGMRQSGIIAAAGLVGLRDMLARVPEDNHRARLLANELMDIPGLNIAQMPPSNIVSIELTQTDRWDAKRFASALANEGILAKVIGKQRLRMVTHYQIEECHVQKTVAAVRKLLAPSESYSISD